MASVGRTLCDVGCVSSRKSPCWSKALFCSSRIWWKTVVMSGRASTDSRMSRETEV